MNTYMFYNHLLEQHVNTYKNEKIIIFIQNGSNYEMLSNMNDYVDLSHIARITDLRIGSKNVNNIHYISFPTCELDIVQNYLHQEQYIIIIVNTQILFPK